jgi:hypothetical protein
MGKQVFDREYSARVLPVVFRKNGSKMLYISKCGRTASQSCGSRVCWAWCNSVRWTVLSTFFSPVLQCYRHTHITLSADTAVWLLRRETESGNVFKRFCQLISLYSFGSRWLLYEHTGLVEWYWYGQAEVLAEKPVPWLLYPAHTVHGRASEWERRRPLSARAKPRPCIII